MNIKNGKIIFTEDELIKFLSLAIENYQGNPAKKPSKLRESMAKGLNLSNYNALKPLITNNQADHTCPDCNSDLTKSCSVTQTYYIKSELDSYSLGFYKNDGSFDSEGKSEYIKKNAPETVDSCTRCKFEIKSRLLDTEFLSDTKFKITSVKSSGDEKFQINGNPISSPNNEKFKILSVDWIKKEYKKDSFKNPKTSLDIDIAYLINSPKISEFVILDKKQGRILSQENDRATHYNRACISLIKSSEKVSEKTCTDYIITSGITDDKNVFYINEVAINPKDHENFKILCRDSLVRSRKYGDHLDQNNHYSRELSLNSLRMMPKYIILDKRNGKLLSSKTNLIDYNNACLLILSCALNMKL